ncbi:MAG: hypothetical protein Q9217_005559 [Psora testacea]
MEKPPANEEGSSKAFEQLETTASNTSNEPSPTPEPEECSLLFHPYDETHTKVSLRCCLQHICNQCLADYQSVDHAGNSYLCPFCRQPMQGSPPSENENDGLTLDELRARMIQAVELLRQTNDMAEMRGEPRDTQADEIVAWTDNILADE